MGVSTKAVPQAVPFNCPQPSRKKAWVKVSAVHQQRCIWLEDARAPTLCAAVWGRGVGMGYGGAYRGKKVSQSVPKCPKVSDIVHYFQRVCHCLPPCAISLFWSLGWTLLPGRELLRFSASMTSVCWNGFRTRDHCVMVQAFYNILQGGKCHGARAFSFSEIAGESVRGERVELRTDGISTGSG